MKFGYGLIFLAGLVSFLSPCVLSLLPVYMGLLGGTSEGSFQQQSLKRIQSHTLLRTISFAAGFTLIFVLLGLSFTFIGNALYQTKGAIASVGGLLIILFGLHATGIVHLPLLEREQMLRPKGAGTNSMVSAFLMGIAFSAGWSPCIGPILGSILTSLVISNASLDQGIAALLVYSLGMTVPFLIVNFGMGRLVFRLRENHSVIHWIQVGSGILLVIMGFLLATGIMSRISQFGDWIHL